MESLTSKRRTDGGGIRGLSELLIIKEVMGRLMAEENAIRERAGIEPLSKPSKSCKCLEVIVLEGASRYISTRITVVRKLFLTG